MKNYSKMCKKKKWKENDMELFHYAKDNNQKIYKCEKCGFFHLTSRIGRDNLLMGDFNGYE